MLFELIFIFVLEMVGVLVIFGILKFVFCKKLNILIVILLGVFFVIFILIFVVNFFVGKSVFLFYLIFSN